MIEYIKTQSHYNITIIGGGMVGMSLALLLAHANAEWRIALLDAQSFSENEANFFHASFDARSTAIAHGSISIFQSLDVWGKLSEQATAIRKIHISDAGHLMGGVINAQDYAVDAVGYVIPNQWIGKVLLSAMKNLPNIQLFSSTCAEKITPKKTGAAVQLRHTTSTKIEQIETDLVIMADGGQSKLAQQLGIDFNIQPYHQTAIIANVAFSEPHQHTAYERFTELGPIALLPLGKSASAQEAALVLTLPEKQASELLNAPEEIFLTHLQKRFGNRLGNFLRVGQRHAYPLQLVTAKEQIRSHLVLIGNAAHFLHPVAGQGFNLSLRDCASLTRQLTQSETPLGKLSVLQDYLARQHKDQSTTILFSDQLVKIFSNSKLPLIALRHLGFLGLESIPSLKNILVHQTMGKTG